MSGRPFVPRLEERVGILPSQAQAIKKNWATLYITLNERYDRPYLDLSLGPVPSRFTPKGYRTLLARLIVPTKEKPPPADTAQRALPL